MGTETEFASNWKPARRTADQRKADRLKRREARRQSPTGQHAEKVRADRAEERHRLKIKRLVWKRSSRCEVCADTEAQTAQKSHVDIHEMHEVRPRSLTMNAPADERFSLENCMRVCHPCHADLGMSLGGRKLRIVFHDAERGVRGDYDIVDFSTGHILRVMRRDIEQCRVLPATFDDAPVASSLRSPEDGERERMTSE